LHRKNFGEKMDIHKLSGRQSVYALAIFLLITTFLTYGALSASGLIIGDNFYWNKSTVNDILGPTIIHQSYLGDISILSTFKGGFLFPLAWMLSSANIPMTFIYPFLFYFFSMFAFYLLSGEFLKKTTYRIIVSVAYLINPVTPYYFVSMLSAFVIVFLPLSLLFLVRALKRIEKPDSSIFSSNIVLSAFFLGLCISAHEQFLPTALIIGFFFLITFIIFSLMKLGSTQLFLKKILSNTGLFAGVIAVVNIPLALSFQNLSQAPLSTYFAARFSDFVANVQYTYAYVNIDTLLRLGGDAGVGFGQNSWFDFSSITNLFGYIIFATIVTSVLYLITLRKDVSAKSAFFVMCLGLFSCAIALLFFVQYLSANSALAQKLFGLVLQTWESPAKLRLLLLLSGLTLSFLAFQKLEQFDRNRRQKSLSVLLLAIIAVSLVIYNSPWVTNVAGTTPMQPMSDFMGWGNLYDNQYSSLANTLQSNYSNDRGLIVPYTHKAELYSTPNFRLFQLVSTVNDATAQFTRNQSISWSKLLGLFSIKNVVINNGEFNPNEMLIFPKTGYNYSQVDLTSLKNDSALLFDGQSGNFSFYQNQNALPEIYATKYYILYDNLGTLKYALNYVDFGKLPVFIGASEQVNQLTVPTNTQASPYQIIALSLQNSTLTNQPLAIISGNQTNTIVLDKTSAFDNLNVFSSTAKLNAGDILEVPNSQDWTPIKHIDQTVLNSSTLNLGDYESFNLTFNVNLLQRGMYSFLGPRVVIQQGTMQYYIIFHDTGAVELATMQNGVWQSNVIAQQLPYDLIQHLPYDLGGSEKSINVSVSKLFDQVNVWVNGQPALEFSIEPKSSNVTLTSQQSTSKFSNIDLQTKNVLKLFATREFSSNPHVTVKEQGTETSTLEVGNVDSGDYAVVDQYLKSSLHTISAPDKTHTFTANLFFNGWIINATSSNAEKATITVSVNNAQWVLGLTYISIAATWTIILFSLIYLSKKPKTLYKILQKAKKKPEAKLFV
jgi:hypothetical protein